VADSIGKQPMATKGREMKKVFLVLVLASLVVPAAASALSVLPIKVELMHEGSSEWYTIASGTDSFTVNPDGCEPATSWCTSYSVDFPEFIPAVWLDNIGAIRTAYDVYNYCGSYEPLNDTTYYWDFDAATPSWKTTTGSTIYMGFCCGNPDCEGTVYLNESNDPDGWYWDFDTPIMRYKYFSNPGGIGLFITKEVTC
jgi:hypothetical protein